jgi:hypothetical protein
MTRKSLPIELLILSTAVGIAATFAAPWLELRGTYAAWRIVEWHTFWRGESAFQLASVVASDYRVTVEYATGEMQLILRACFALGSALGIWHASVLIVLLALGARMRLRAGASWPRVALEFAAIAVLNAAVTYLLALFLALPSSLTPKVDFRAGAEIHSDSLIWSNVAVLPVAPAFALIALAVDVFALVKLVRERQSRPSSSRSEMK